MTVCPYCGSQARVITPTTWFGRLDHSPSRLRAYMAHCPECKATGPWRESEAEASEAWSNPAPIKPTESIAQEAHRICHGDRQEDYGHPLDDFTRVGKMWGIQLNREPIPAEIVAAMMVTLKLSRETEKPKRDNRVDIAGYATCLDRIHDERARRSS